MFVPVVELVQTTKSGGTKSLEICTKGAFCELSAHSLDPNAPARSIYRTTVQADSCCDKFSSTISIGRFKRAGVQKYQ